MRDKIISIICIIVLLGVMIGSVKYIVNPKGVREFHKKYPYFDRYGRIQHDSDIVIRIKGVALEAFCLILLFVFLKYGMDCF